MDISKVKKALVPRMYKASWLMVIVFTILFVADMWSTFRVGEVVHYLEANPLYQIGGFGLIIFMNFIALYTFLYLYHKKGNTFRFFLCSEFVFFSLTRISVVINNFKIGQVAIQSMKENPEATIAAAKAITYASKINQTFFTILIGVIVPIAVSMMVYGMFRMDHEVKLK